MVTVVDYSAAPLAGREVKDAGHIGTVRYISPAREAWMGGKPENVGELKDHTASGLETAFVWQFGKETHPDVMRGLAGGVDDATRAQAKLAELGCPNHPVFFAVDFDISLGQWNSTAVHYFEGAVKVLGRERVGIYGHSRVIAWAAQDNVIAPVGNGKWLAWQTPAWSRGERAPEAVLYQGSQASINGVPVDVNQVLNPYWGQTPPPKRDTPVFHTGMKPNPNHRGDPLFLPELLKLWGVKVEEFDGWRDRGQGDFGAITHVICHHTAGANTPPSLIAFGRAGLWGALSQICLTRDGVAHIVAAGVAWHAGVGSYPGIPRNAANQQTVGIEAVNAGDGSQPWPEEQLDAYARICAALCWYLGWTVDRVIGHKEWNPVGKIDPNFDMNDFRRRVAYLLDNPPFLNGETVMNLEEQHQSRAFINGKRSAYRGTLVDFWLNADAHAYTARVNTEALIKRVDELEKKIDGLVKAVTS